MIAPSIRPALPRDIPAITRIYAHAVTFGTASFEIDPPDEAEMAKRQAALLSAEYPYLVAGHGGRIAGYAYAGPYRARPAYRWTVEDTVYVAPESQRLGIGRALLARLILAAEAAGFRQMIAVIGDSAQAPSIELHRAAGFRMVGTLEAVGYKHDRWLRQCPDAVHPRQGRGGTALGNDPEKVETFPDRSYGKLKS